MGGKSPHPGEWKSHVALLSTHSSHTCSTSVQCTIMYIHKYVLYRNFVLLNYSPSSELYTYVPPLFKGIVARDLTHCVVRLRGMYDSLGVARLHGMHDPLCIARLRGMHAPLCIARLRSMYEPLCEVRLSSMPDSHCVWTDSAVCMTHCV